jgi:hypothetical protein
MNRIKLRTKALFVLLLFAANISATATENKPQNWRKASETESEVVLDAVLRYLDFPKTKSLLESKAALPAEAHVKEEHAFIDGFELKVLFQGHPISRVDISVQRNIQTILLFLNEPCISLESVQRKYYEKFEIPIEPTTSMPHWSRPNDSNAQRRRWVYFDWPHTQGFAIAARLTANGPTSWIHFSPGGLCALRVEYSNRLP